MTDYNDGKWHGWESAPCPLDLRSKVDAVWQRDDGSVKIISNESAGDVSFFGNEHGNVIAFRVVKEHKEPREFWVELDAAKDIVGIYEHQPNSPRVHDLVHVREVLE